MEDAMFRRRQSVGVRLSNVITVLFLAVLPAVAQQRPLAAASPSDQFKADEQETADQNSHQKTDANKPSDTSNDRLFYTLPNFLTVENAGQVPPLTAKQKFKLEARSQFDPVEIVWYGFLAGISQANNSEPGYGQGAAGYGKRYAAAWGDGAIENFMVGAALPSLLRQDPRFFQLGKGSFWHRTRYAIGRIFIIRTDSGNREFNYSEVFGSAMSAGISTYTYHPHGDRTLGNTASVWGTQVGLDTLTLVVKEFWPDIRRKISRKRQLHTPTP
jgi:hypothetical protein